MNKFGPMLSRLQRIVVENLAWQIIARKSLERKQTSGCLLPTIPEDEVDELTRHIGSGLLTPFYEVAHRYPRGGMLAHMCRDGHWFRPYFDALEHFFGERTFCLHTLPTHGGALAYPEKVRSGDAQRVNGCRTLSCDCIIDANLGHETVTSLRVKEGSIRYVVAHGHRPCGAASREKISLEEHIGGLADGAEIIEKSLRSQGYNMPVLALFHVSLPKNVPLTRLLREKGALNPDGTILFRVNN